MSKFDHAINYLAAKGVKMVIKTSYEDGKPVSRSLLTKLVITKKDQFYRVNDKVVSGGMAKSLMRMGAAA